MRHFGREKFQGHSAAQLRVLGFIHHPHAASAERFENAVVRESLTDQGSRIHDQAHILVCCSRRVNNDDLVPNSKQEITRKRAVTLIRAFLLKRADRCWRGDSPSQFMKIERVHHEELTNAINLDSRAAETYIPHCSGVSCQAKLCKILPKSRYGSGFRTVGR